MDKKLLAHEQFMQTEIKNIEQELSNTKIKNKTAPVHKKITKLNQYHISVMRDFQHERLIHLIVTIVFFGLLLLSIVAMFLFAFLPVSYDYALLSKLSLLIICILFITEIFYIKHYFQLENGTQKLYKFTEKLYKIDK